ncbi:hypothetical protein D7X98_01460 [bacterium 1XD8-76]|nr:hypothetical protein D7X98_01460 [bacterium 1XD8-76]
MKYNYFQDEKRKYEDIEIPDELLLLVRQTVAQDRRKKASVRRNRILRAVGSVAAVLFLCVAIGVNTSYAFAETAVKIPVVKSIAKTVVVRSYRPEIIAVYEQNKSGKNSKNSGEPEEAPNTEQPQPEVVPTESGNDVISGDVVQPEKTEEQPEKPVEGMDAWKAEMTVDKFREVTERYTPEMEERYADAPEKLRTILLAEMPEKGVSLYGYHEDKKITGVALLVEDSVQYFDWNYMNHTGKLPDISTADVNEDGEEEIIVLLYNGAPQKKEISKEDIAEPGTEKEKGQNGGTETETAPEEQPADIEEETETTVSDQSETPADSANDTNGANDTEKTTVSGNDIKPAEPEKKPEPVEQKAGEIWVISPGEGDWTANMLSVNDYESQILHQLKAEYDEGADAVQLYLMEEPFGEPVKLSDGDRGKLTFEAANLAPEREFVSEKGLSLYFRMEAAFLNADGEEEVFGIDRGLKAEVCLENGSFTLENIKER